MGGSLDRNRQRAEIVSADWIKKAQFSDQEQALVFSWLYQKSPRTQKYYRRVISEFFSRFHWVSLHQFEIGHFVLFMKSKEHLKPASRNTMKNALSSLFSFLFKAGHLAKDPTLTWTAIKVPSGLGRKILERDQIQRMLDCEPDTRNRLIIKMLYLTGLRVSELCQLKVQDVKVKDEERMVLHVLGKGTKVRSVLIPLSVWQEVRDNLAIQEGEIMEQEAPLFRSKKAPYKALDPSQVFRIIKLAAKRAKVDPLPSPHWFRHTSATHAIENGAPLHVVQRTLGHESIATTGRYLDARPNESSSDYLVDFEET